MFYDRKFGCELDFVLELDCKVLPIEVKSEKAHETHCALSDIMDCGEYRLPEAIIFYNGNLRINGKIVYASIYWEENAHTGIYKKDIRGWDRCIQPLRRYDLKIDNG